jgi:Phosphate-induced protein 1 conserved region
MLRVTKYFSLLALLSPACWAQTPSSPGGVTAGFKIVGMAPVISRSGSTMPKYNGITYLGGPIIDDANGVNAYYIWYGDWSKDKAAQTIMVDFIKHLGGSPYFNTNTTYYDYEVGPTGTSVVKDRVVNSVHYMGSTNDYYSLGNILSVDDIGTIIQNTVAQGRLPLDHNGVYSVLTSADVTVKDVVGDFCISYCAFHGAQAAGALGNLVGAFVGNAETQCPYQCDWEYVLPTPNNNVGADGMVNMIAHELEESVTDPLGTSWTLPGFIENADLCQWTFGTTYNLTNGSFANMKLGERQYLIQQNWVNAKGGYCALKWDE